jgi:hypothetical protein
MKRNESLSDDFGFLDVDGALSPTHREAATPNRKKRRINFRDLSVSGAGKRALDGGDDDDDDDDDDDNAAPGHSGGLGARAPCDRSTVIAAAGAIFDSFCAEPGGSVIADGDYAALAQHLGWPHTPRPHFLVLCYTNFVHTEKHARTSGQLNRAAFVAAMLAVGRDTLEGFTAAVWAWLSAAYRGNSAAYAEFHRFVFVLNLIEHSRLHQHQAKLGDAKEGHMTNRFGTYCRAVPVKMLQHSLLVTLSQLSPFVHTFAQFLNESHVQQLNLDQWMNFTTFSRVVDYPSVANYADDDCWPCVYDDYVGWMRRNVAMPAAAAAAAAAATGQQCALVDDGDEDCEVCE